MKNLYSRVIDTKNLYLAWEKVKNISNEEYIFNRDYIEYYNNNIENIIDIIKYELESDKFNFDMLHCFEVPKKNGKRVFHIDTVKNMIVMQAVLNVIGEKIEKEFINESYGYRLSFENNEVYKDWSSSYQDFADTLEKWYAKNKSKNYTILRFDVEAFFDKVKLDELIKMLQSKIDDEKTLEIIKKYLMVDRVYQNSNEERSGLAQGVFSSGFFANIYLNEFDKRIKGKVSGYVRYVDDLFILVENQKLPDIKELVYSELDKLMLKPNYDKYSECIISDYQKLQNLKNNIKYEAINFIDAQIDNLSEKDKERLFKNIEGKLLENKNKDIKLEDLKDYTDHINYLLFLSKKLGNINNDYIDISLCVLERESIKYSKLERIYKNLFSLNIENEFIYNRVSRFPDYAKLSLAKFLLSEDNMNYNSNLVDNYLQSESYLVNLCGLMLANKINYSVDIMEIIDEIGGEYEIGLLLDYYLTNVSYNSKGDLDKDFILKYFSHQPNKFLLYIYKFIDEDAILQLLEGNKLKTDNLYNLIYLVKLFFKTENKRIYEIILEDSEYKFLWYIFKKVILLYINSPEENADFNISSLIQIYHLVEQYPDKFSQKLLKELKFNISDTQLVIKREYINFHKVSNQFLEELNYEKMIKMLHIYHSTIRYYLVTYDGKKYLLEKADKGIFGDKTNYDNYVDILNRLHKNNLIGNIKITPFDDYSYVYILYEIEDFNDLLYMKFLNEERLSFDYFRILLEKAEKYHSLINLYPIMSSYNIIINNNKIMFTGVLSQLNYNMYESVLNNKKSIKVNRTIESFGYLFIENNNYKEFLNISQEKNYLKYFELPHIDNILGKIYTDNLDYKYKNIKFLIADLSLAINFNKFIDSISENDEIKNMIIAYDYLGFRMSQYKRFLDTVSDLIVIVKSIEEIINSFNNYIKHKSIYFKKYLLLKSRLAMKLKIKKINKFSTTILLVIANIYKNSFEHVDKYRKQYDFYNYISFLSYSIVKLGNNFEIYSRNTIYDEVAVDITKENKYNFSQPAFLDISECESNDGEECINSYFNKIIETIRGVSVNAAKAKKIKRKYGKLQSPGVLLEGQSKKILIKYGLINMRKKEIKQESISNTHKEYLMFWEYPKISFDYNENEVSNVNIESKVAKNFWAINKENKNKKESKIKNLFYLLTIFTLWSAIYSVIIIISGNVSKMHWLLGLAMPVIVLFIANTVKEATKESSVKIIDFINKPIKKIFKKG